MTVYGFLGRGTEATERRTGEEGTRRVPETKGSVCSGRGGGSS